MKVGPDRRVRKSLCLNCGTELDATNVVDEKPITKTRPSPGDFSICLKCGHLMVFGKKLILRNPTDDELAKIAGDKRMVAIQQARAHVFAPKFEKDETVDLTVDGRTVEATVIIASPNSRSLFLGFEAILDGHVGKMPVFRDDNGTYRTLISGKVIQVTKRKH